jgi:hypothetical protein
MADAPPPNKPSKPRKTRSPNYPSTDLESAVTKVGELHAKIHRHAIPTQDALAELGYSAKSSSGLQLIGALVAFGLVDSEGRGDDRRLTISQEAVRIIHEPKDSDKRAQSLRDCALNPAIHQKLWEKFGGNLPKSDQIIRSFLIVDHGFTEDAATQLITEYRATFKYAGLDGSLLIENNEGAEGDGYGGQAPPTPPAIGDYVQWTSQSLDQFKTPRQLKSISDDREWAFVEGSETGVPFAELTKQAKPPSEKPMPVATPPANPFYTPPKSEQDLVPISVLMGKGVSRVISIPKMSAKAFQFFKSQLDAFEEAIVDEGEIPARDQDD